MNKNNRKSRNKCGSATQRECLASITEGLDRYFAQEGGAPTLTGLLLALDMDAEQLRRVLNCGCKSSKLIKRTLIRLKDTAIRTVYTKDPAKGAAMVLSQLEKLSGNEEGGALLLLSDEAEKLAR